MKFNSSIETNYSPYLKVEKKILHDNSKMSLDDVCNFFKKRGVAGEEKLIKQIVCMASSKKHFGLEGMSGSGKTFIMDKLIEILPDVYTLNQTSDVATFYDAEKINQSHFLYVPELQKAITGKKNPLVEIIKDIAEGKPATRITTNSSRDGVSKQEINPDLTIIYTLATENNFKPDKEFSRRFMKFETDSSETHIREVLDFQARERYDLSFRGNGLDLLKQKLKYQFAKSFSKNYGVIDPFASLIFKQFTPTPDSITKAKNYCTLVDGYVKFTDSNRENILLGNKTYLLTNFNDHKAVLEMSEYDFKLNDNCLENLKKSISGSYNPKLANDWYKRQVLEL